MNVEKRKLSTDNKNLNLKPIMKYGTVFCDHIKEVKQDGKNRLCASFDGRSIPGSSN